MSDPTKINPDSVVLSQLDGHWQKLAAILLYKLAGREVIKITSADLDKMHADFAPGIPVIFTHGLHDSLEFSIVTEEEATRLAEHDKTMRGNA